MYTLEVETEFAAAHFLDGYQGRCENLHGHNWRVSLAVTGEALDAVGMLVDFSLLKQWLRGEIEKLDHRLLNETPPFDAMNPTSENIARHLARQMAARLPEGVKVECVRVWESDKARAEYRFPT